MPLGLISIGKKKIRILLVSKCGKIWLKWYVVKIVNFNDFKFPLFSVVIKSLKSATLTHSKVVISLISVIHYDYHHFDGLIWTLAMSIWTKWVNAAMIPEVLIVWHGKPHRQIQHILTQSSILCDFYWTPFSPSLEWLSGRWSFDLIVWFPTGWKGQSHYHYHSFLLPLLLYRFIQSFFKR